MSTQRQQINIFDDNAVPINQNFVITLTEGDNIDHEMRNKCKILKFSSEFDFDKILLTISKLDSKHYPNLFIFIIETENSVSSESVKCLKNFLVSFSATRPIILQLTSKKEEKMKVFYKEENSDKLWKLPSSLTFCSSNSKNLSEFSSL